MKNASHRRLAGLVVTGIGLLAATAICEPADARGNRESREEFVQSRPGGPPLMAIVALNEQRVTIYDAEGKILRAPVSTGRSGYETPAGIYSVIQKEAEHYSNLYDDASMPFMQRITWSGIALHAGALPGYPASHGCIRLPYTFAERLFELTKLGLRVVVVPSDVTPVGIAHPTLFKPLPAGSAITLASTQPADASTTTDAAQPMRLGLAPAESGITAPADGQARPQTWRAIAAAKQAEVEAATRKADEARAAASKLSLEAGRLAKTLRIANGAKARAESQVSGAELALATATTPEAQERAEAAKAKATARLAEAQAQLDTTQAEVQPKMDAAARASEAAKALDTEKAAAIAAAKEAASKLAPISVFVSRQAQKLYVRQQFRPVMEVPITIRDADKPIGTHIFTALDYANDGADVRWSVVSMYAGQQGKPEPASQGRRRQNTERSSEPATSDVSAAKAALDRLEIPQEALQRISEVVSPGSSLIVSDEPASRETSKGTDFIVVMSGEPQGGIKIRRRAQPYAYGRSPYYRGYGSSPFFQW